jgi:hypothetical protein
MSAVAPAIYPVGHATRRIPRSWPLYAVILSFPLWWLIGAAYFIWPLLTLPLLLSLLLRRKIHVPPRFGLWILFLVWMLLSSSQLDRHSGTLAFAWRAAVYFSATTLFLYVFNADRDRLSNKTIRNVLTIFWVELIVGGFLGVLFPRVSFSTPVEHLLPSSLLADETTRRMVHPQFAEVMTFLGYPVGRPSVLFPYSNQWGACVGILIPVTVAAMMVTSRGLRRRLLSLLLILSIVPIIFSLNRGMWLALAAAGAYVTLRYVRLGNIRAVAAAGVVLAVAATIVVASPLGSVFNDRLSKHSNSTQTRLSVYDMTTQQVKSSPFFGYGSPRASTDPNSPPLGTQGQFFLLLYSHGIPGVAFFVAWFGYGLFRSFRRRSRDHVWAHIAIIIFLIEMPFYSFMPTTLHVIMLPAALIWRDIATRTQRSITA